MLGQERFGPVINLCMNIVVGALLGYLALSMSGGFNGLAFVQSLLISMGVGYLLGDWLPAYAIGQKLADKLKIKNGILRHAVATLVLCAIFVTLVSFVCMFIAFGPSMFPIWTSVLPVYWGVGYIALLIAMPISMKIATALTGFDPAGEAKKAAATI